MPDLFTILSHWWKRIMLLGLLTAIVTAGVLFFIPKKYMGKTTALPATAYSTDKSSVFSQNLQNLYSAIGNSDDLDWVLGTASLDTVYTSVAKQHELVHYYNIDTGASSLIKASHELKRNSKVTKTDYGELQVKVWDTDAIMAATLANAIMDKLQQIHQEVQTTNNSLLLARIDTEYQEKNSEFQRLADSLQNEKDVVRIEYMQMKKASLLRQLEEYDRLADQYKLMVDAQPKALIIIENAVPAIKTDKPRWLPILVAATFLALFFGLASAVISERNLQVAHRMNK